MYLSKVNRFILPFREQGVNIAVLEAVDAGDTAEQFWLPSGRQWAKIKL